VVAVAVGEILKTPEDFQGALAEEHAVLTGGELAGAARNYVYIVRRGVEKIANVTIEESFLGELRHLDVDDISERMNSDVSDIRFKPAADMRCMVSLIDHVGKKPRSAKRSACCGLA
jgi:hypothetical protein